MKLSKKHFKLLILFMILGTVSSSTIAQVYNITDADLRTIKSFKGDEISGESFKFDKGDDTHPEINELHSSDLDNFGILIKADLSICTDGSGSRYQASCTDSLQFCYDSHHQNETALPFDKNYLNADKVSYLVLPGKDEYYWEEWRFEKGDIGVIINMYKNENKLIFAIFGEVGPDELIGEASVYASRQLDNCPCVVKNGQHKFAGIPQDVYYIVFRNTRNTLFQNKNLTNDNLNDYVTSLGKQKMKDFFGIEFK